MSPKCPAFKILFIKGHFIFVVTFLLDNESSLKFCEIYAYLIIVFQSHYFLLVNFLYRYFMITSLQPVVDPIFTLSLIKIYRDKVILFLTVLCRKEPTASINSVGIASSQIVPEQIEITSL
ncbi:unnamed protein product [Caenorhabditis auriculariae]|uniref:Uncharacterized protein n=1 Tax=Caenorhabditis auriculariae TaxID=2777116 RepID=A0A8S1HD61_9PELO|nr:unnamed protein product [Caenorhabditis auriculariae]